jgi:hypothetical protein
MFTLVFTRDGRTIRHVLPPGDTVVGRAPVCDLVIDDPSISRRHVRFRVHGQQCQVTELGGRNGTFINGRQITEGVLASGDTIVLGRVAFQLQVQRPDAVALSSRQALLDAAATVQQPTPTPTANTQKTAGGSDIDRAFSLIGALARHLVDWRSLEEAMDRTISIVFAVTPAERGFLVMVDPASGQATPRVARMREGGELSEATLNRSVIERVVATRESILAGDTGASADTAPTGQVAGDRRSFACVPLAASSGVLGVIYADAPDTAPLGPADLRVLRALAGFAAAVLEYAATAPRRLSGVRKPQNE